MLHEGEGKRKSYRGARPGKHGLQLKVSECTEVSEGPPRVLQVMMEGRWRGRAGVCKGGA